MRFRWLLGNFSDPDHRLGPEAERRISTLAHKRHMPTGRFVWWSLLAILLPILLLHALVLPRVLQWLGLSGRTWPSVLGMAVITALVWPLSAFVYGHLYLRPVRRAMRDTGIDVCVACGYHLHRLPVEVAQCPECGAPREAPAPDQ